MRPGAPVSLPANPGAAGGGYCGAPGPQRSLEGARGIGRGEAGSVFWRGERRRTSGLCGLNAAVGGTSALQRRRRLTRVVNNTEVHCAVPRQQQDSDPRNTVDISAETLTQRPDLQNVSQFNLVRLSQLYRKTTYDGGLQMILLGIS